jgi:hypothetical protein
MPAPLPAFEALAFLLKGIRDPGKAAYPEITVCAMFKTWLRGIATAVNQMP